MTWNPDNWTWTNLQEQAQRTADGGSVEEPWSCGNSKSVKSGERLFLLKQGRKLPKGIIAAGVSTSKSYQDKHWNSKRAAQGDMANYVEAEWETILDPAYEDLLPVSACQYDGLPSVNWNTMASGIEIPQPVARILEEVWSRHVEAIRAPQAKLVASPIDDEEEFPEGRVLYRLHRTHERSPKLVAKAKARALRNGGKLRCEVCNFDFYAKYGELGKDYIECHHTIPVCELDCGNTTKLKDVALVCSNCHRILHRKRPWLSIDKLRERLKG